MNILLKPFLSVRQSNSECRFPASSTTPAVICLTHADQNTSPCSCRQLMCIQIFSEASELWVSYFCTLWFHHSPLSKYTPINPCYHSLAQIFLITLPS